MKKEEAEKVMKDFDNHAAFTVVVGESLKEDVIKIRKSELKDFLMKYV